MRFLPTAFPLALLQANTNQGHQITALPRCFPSEIPTIPIPPGPLPPPFLLCPPPLGLWHLPQTEHPRGPLGNPSARSIEVFLIVTQAELNRRLHMHFSSLSSFFWFFLLFASYMTENQKETPQEKTKSTLTVTVIVAHSKSLSIRPKTTGRKWWNGA